MPQQHLDRLNAVDASFLHQEGSSTHMHIGGVAIFEGPCPKREDFLEHIRARLPLVPRYRQKIAVPPVGLGRQRWVDDPSFNLDYHVRHTALPRPGDEETLRRLTGRIFSQALDRTKPLWEIWLVEGLSGERFAVLNKTHHALVDGVSGADLMTVLFDITRTPQSIELEDSWQPRPEPTSMELSAVTVASWARALMSLPWRLAAAAARPRAALAELRDALEGVGEVALAGLTTPAPDTPLNVKIGPHRRVAFVPAALEDFKEVKNALGGTVNDVVLTVTAGALARFFEQRGLRVEGLELRGCVPISVRPRGDQDALGNRITQVVTELPIHVSDPVERLRRVRSSMDGLKESKQALGAEAIAGAQDFAPPTILAQASRLNFSSRFYNLLVTNVPGPQIPLYAMGRELQSMFPMAFLAGDRALAVAIMSYNGAMNFGLIADYDEVPDLDVFAEAIEEALGELLAAARGKGPGRGRRRRTGARTVAARTGASNGGGEKPSRPRSGTRPAKPRSNGRSPTLEPDRA
jgi:WS/DGAT/MGAT family acyltransferase